MPERPELRNCEGGLRPVLLPRLLLAGLLVLTLPVLGGDKKKDDPAELKTRIEHEQDPVKRAEFQLRLSSVRLDEAREQYDAGADDKGLATLKQMQGLVEQVEEGLFGTGRDPRKKPKGFKDSEIKLREMQRRLQDLMMQLPVDERPPIEEIRKRLADIQEEFLYGIMRVKEPQAALQPSKEPKP